MRVGTRQHDGSKTLQQNELGTFPWTIEGSRVHLGTDIVARVILLAGAIDPRWFHNFAIPFASFWPVGTSASDFLLVT